MNWDVAQGEDRPEAPDGSIGMLRPIGRGITAALPVALTVVVAIVLAMQEQVLVAQRGEWGTPATVSSPLPRETMLVAPATSTPVAATNTATTMLATKAVPTPTQARARPRRTTAPTSCVKRWDWPSYRIQPGDTLSSIATRCGSSIQALQEANCLYTDRIYAGGTLLVPRLPPSEPTQRPTSRPRPTRTGSPTPKPTATGSETPSPTVTEEPTPDPGTNTPTHVPPTATPGPTNTPVLPTSTPSPDPPTATPEPTNTPPPPTNTPLTPTETPSG